MNILFVCLGNICRSPAAEGIFESLVKKRGLEKKIHIDSCGTSAFHTGDRADARMREHAMKRGYTLNSISRGFESPRDFKNFDYILAMDQSNFKDLKNLDRSELYSQKIILMTDFCLKHEIKSVPDPYYGGSEGFDYVIDILEDACDNFLNHLQKNHF